MSRQDEFVRTRRYFEDNPSASIVEAANAIFGAATTFDLRYVELNVCTLFGDSSELHQRLLKEFNEERWRL